MQENHYTPQQMAAATLCKAARPKWDVNQLIAHSQLILAALMESFVKKSPDKWASRCLRCKKETVSLNS